MRAHPWRQHGHWLRAVAISRKRCRARAVVAALVSVVFSCLAVWVLLLLLGENRLFMALPAVPLHAGRDASKTDLGFEYPQLARSRALLQDLLLLKPSTEHWALLSATYTAALDAVVAEAGGTQLQERRPAQAPTPPAPDGTQSLDTYLREALAVLLSEAPPGSLLRCEPDESLTKAWSGNGSHAASTALPAASRRYLLAANLHDSAAVLPNLIVAVLRLALALPPGSLAVSLYESGSSDTTRLWMTLLHQLLLPLSVPHTITLHGSLSPRLGLARIQLLAALRNAALQPWLPPPQGAADAALAHAAASSKQRQGERVLSHAPGSLCPDVIAFSNDVMLCAGDVLRLAAHDAHIACGLDFYTAPWQHHHHHQQQQQQAGDMAAAGGAAGGAAPVGPDTDRPTAAVAAAAGGDAPVSLQFYDKWVARDATGARLHNAPPYVAHAKSAARLAAGLPVAAACCWNGLALLAAGPLVAGLRFRAAAPGECAASEASLLCDDYARLGLTHVVMDPGVALAYQPDQAKVLAGARRAWHVQGPGSNSSGGSRQGTPPPALPWAAVSTTSAELAASAAQERHACATTPGGCARLVECCDLQPGAMIVNFEADCHFQNSNSINYTAAVLAGVTA